MDIGYRDSSLCIYKKNKLIFFRKLTFSSDKLTQALTTTLASAEGRLTLSYEQAEEVKCTFGIPFDQSSVLQDGVQATQIISLMRPLLEKLVIELRRSFDYFSANFRETLSTTLYITGGGASLKNIDRYLNKELRVNVSKLPVPDFLKRPKLKEERFSKERDQLTNALGAALAGTKAINLLPHEVRAQRVELIEKISLRLVAVTVGLIFLFSLFVVKLQTRDYKNRLKNARAHLETISEIKLLTQKVSLRENFLKKMQQGNLPADKMLKIVSALIPAKVILTELFFEKGSYNLVLKGVVSAGEESGEIVLTEFMETLEGSALFTEATLVSFKTVGAAQRFEIVCELAR